MMYRLRENLASLLCPEMHRDARRWKRAHYRAMALGSELRREFLAASACVEHVMIAAMNDVTKEDAVGRPNPLPHYRLVEGDDGGYPKMEQWASETTMFVAQLRKYAREK